MKALLQTADGPNILDRLRNEISIMSYLAGHPNIVQLQDVYETPSSLYIIQELCTGGSVLDTVRVKAPLGEDAAASIFRGIVKSVLHCHQVRLNWGRPRDGPPRGSSAHSGRGEVLWRTRERMHANYLKPAIE